MRCAHSFRGARKTTGKIEELPGIFGNARLRPAKRRSLRRASAASPPASAHLLRSPRPRSSLSPLPGPLFPADDSACRAPFSCRQRADGQSRPPDSVLRPAKNRCRKTLPPLPPDTKNPRAESPPAGMISAFTDVRTDRTHGPAQTQPRQDQAEASLLSCSTLSSRRKITSNAPLTSRQIQGLELTKPATR